MGASSDKTDKMATKYCFKATAHLKAKEGRLLASFTAYDKSPEVAASVQRACEVTRADHQGRGAEELECSVVELLMYDVCPTESDGEVSTVFH